MKSKEEILTSNHFELTPRNMKTENEMGFLNIEYRKSLYYTVLRLKYYEFFVGEKDDKTFKLFLWADTK